MDPEAELFRLLEQEAKWQRYHKIATMYQPGPFGLDKYPKHAEILAAGKIYRERAFLGGNGCVSRYTRIETPEAPRRIEELIGTAGFDVLSWDGARQCIAPASGVFLKELAPAFRVFMDNGQWFDCTHRHRVLTTFGMLWFGHLVHAASGIRYQSNLTAEPAIALCAPPSTEAIRDCILSALEAGEAEQQGRPPPHLPIKARIEDAQRIETICAGFDNPEQELDRHWPQSLLVSMAGLAHETDPTQRILVDGKEIAAQCLPVLSQNNADWCRENGLYAQPIMRGQWALEAIDGACAEWAFCPWDHAPLVGGQKILAIIPLGIQPIFDFTVEGTHTYYSAGVIHHNTGKTEGVGAYETTLHLTGDYPDWWEGLRFDHPINAWVSGDTRETVRDITQKKLFGDVSRLGTEALGTGLVPRDRIVNYKFVTNTNYAMDYATIRHASGGLSVVGMKSYEQGREAFQGTEQHWQWLDEEPPLDIYLESLMRTRGVDGKILITWTPLRGHSKVVEEFLAWEQRNKDGGSKYVVTCGWDDVPHLSEQWKREQLAAIPPYLRNARRLGIPTAGIGQVYPVEEDQFVINPIPLPAHFRRVAGFDHGYHNTACAWLAYDQDNDVAYLYSDYKRGGDGITKEMHATAIKSRGDWIPVVGDAAARDDAVPVINSYKALGVKMRLPNKARGSVDAGVQEVLSRLSQGKLKVFSTCQKWLDEFRKYQYAESKNDATPQIVKRNDHLMDCTRYAIMDGLKIATTQKIEAVTMPAVRFG